MISSNLKLCTAIGACLVYQQLHILRYIYYLDYIVALFLMILLVSISLQVIRVWMYLIRITSWPSLKYFIIWVTDIVRSLWANVWPAQVWVCVMGFLWAYAMYTDKQNLVCIPPLWDSPWSYCWLENQAGRQCWGSLPHRRSHLTPTWCSPPGCTLWWSGCHRPKSSPTQQSTGKGHAIYSHQRQR